MTVKELRFSSSRKTSAWAHVQKRLAESWQWYVLLIPAIIYVAIFCYGPMYGVQIAFKNYKPKLGAAGSPWLDPVLKNFIRFINYPDFWKMIRNTLSVHGNRQGHV